MGENSSFPCKTGEYVPLISSTSVILNCNIRESNYYLGEFVSGVIISGGTISGITISGVTGCRVTTLTKHNVLKR